jgi:hypothetical protein
VDGDAGDEGDDRGEAPVVGVDLGVDPVRLDDERCSAPDRLAARLQQGRDDGREPEAAEAGPIRPRRTGADPPDEPLQGRSDRDVRSSRYACSHLPSP